MATQWPQQGQQTQYYGNPQSFHPNQQHQAQQHQQPYQVAQNGQYAPNSSSQYQQPTQHYSQAQTYQQQGQYSQFQQYPQTGQYPQVQQYGQNFAAQPYQQPPQNHPQAQQQMINSSQYQPQQYAQAGQFYQNQYYQQPLQQYPQAQQQSTTQQYPSQQYAPQQYVPASNNGYQPSYQQQGSPVNMQVHDTVNSNSCFNCGAPNHIAQNCPEPRRSVPAGALEPQRFANPLKRMKSGSTIVTKFSPPAHSAQAQGYQQSFSPSVYGQNGQSQHQGSHSPGTPASAQSQATNQAWQQYHQWQAYQQTQQLQNFTGASHTPQASQTPTYHAGPSVNGYQQPHQISPATPREEPASHPYKVHYPQNGSGQLSSSSALSTSHMQEAASNPTEMRTSHPTQQTTSLIAACPQPLPTSPQTESLSLAESEEDDINSLDIPDLPKDLSQQYGTGPLPNTMLSPPISLISMPLPANFVVADALYPIPPPGPEAGGRCQSKYLRGVTIETFCENIKASKYWRDHKDDTVFFTRPNDDTVIPLDEVLTQLKQRHAYHETGEGSSRHTRSQSRSASVKKDSVDVLSQVEKLEREIAEMKEKMRKKTMAKSESIATPRATDETQGSAPIKKEQTSPSPSVETGRTTISGQETEDILAALGVTGSPKPIIASGRPHSSQQPENHHALSVDIAPQDHHLCDEETAPHSSGFQIPPPPPPPPAPLGQSSSSDEMRGSPTSNGHSYMNGYAFDFNGADHQNGFHITCSNGELVSPNSASRKRSYARRESSSEEEDALARRQEDDVTSKLKRRQPKVAAAYSRRW